MEGFHATNCFGVDIFDVDLKGEVLVDDDTKVGSSIAPGKLDIQK